MSKIATWLKRQDPPKNKWQWLAIQLGLSKHTIKKWGDWPPAKHCLAIEIITRGDLPAQLLRPDVFGTMDGAVAEVAHEN